MQLCYLFALTQGVFFFTLLICLLLIRSSVAENDGIPFYGVDARTLPFLLMGFVVASFGLWRTAIHFSTFMNWALMSTGVALAIIQAAIAVLLLSRRFTSRSAFGAGPQLLGGLIAAASLPDWHFRYLLQGEILYEMGFGWCLIEWTYALHSRPLRLT